MFSTAVRAVARHVVSHDLQHVDSSRLREPVAEYGVNQASALILGVSIYPCAIGERACREAARVPAMETHSVPEHDSFGVEACAYQDSRPPDRTRPVDPDIDCQAWRCELTASRSVRAMRRYEHRSRFRPVYPVAVG